MPATQRKLRATHDTDNDPWEQRRGETFQAYEAFTKYRDMGQKRSLSKVGLELGKSKTLLDRWSSRHEWVRRCREFDRHMERTEREDIRLSLRSMTQRHATISSAFAGKLATYIRGMKPEELTPSEAIAWLKVSTQVERVTREAAVFEHAQTTSPDGDPTVEHLTAEETEERMRQLREEIDRELGGTTEQADDEGMDELMDENDDE